jgi:membrane-bound serine protease (ClpP class)
MVPVSWVRLAVRAVAASAMVIGSFGLGLSALGADGPAPVLVGTIKDEINPITARYVDRVVTDAEQDGAAAVVFVIDTPGGLIDSTYQITARFLTANVPVITFVAPQGARAASAGTFITMAGHVAAMAPNTNIGAAHPVDSSGGDIQGDLRLKAENDAVAHITNIARTRGRNVQWAEDAVRKSVSVRVDEALTLNVVDLEANDVRDLLAKIDGRTVKLPTREVKLATAGAPVNDDGLNPIEAFLHLIVDPQIAVLLFTLGTYGIIFELSNPGLIFPGIVGVIAILLAFFAFGTLDANGAGIALMIFAIILFVLEIKVPAHGLLTVGGIVSLLIGLVILFPPLRPTLPGLRVTVDPVVIAVIVALTAGFFAFLVRQAARFLRMPIYRPTILGAVGVAKSDLAPEGIALVAAEDWTAVTESGPIPRGSKVRVKRVDGMRLIVEPAQTGEVRGGST